jgi:hypothetical protein
MGEDAIDRSQAWRTYDLLWADERVQWADEPAELDAVWRAISARDDKSHKLWTDDYLAAFAQASDAILITLDSNVPPAIRPFGSSCCDRPEQLAGGRLPLRPA